MRPLVPNVPARHLMKLLVHERNQPVEGAFVASPPFEKQPGDLGGMVRNGPL